MADLNVNLSLDSCVIGVAWEALLTPVSCGAIEVTGSGKWEWCTDQAKAAREVLADIPHSLVPNANGRIKFQQGDAVCWVRGQSPDTTIWIKCCR